MKKKLKKRKEEKLKLKLNMIKPLETVKSINLKNTLTRREPKLKRKDKTKKLSESGNKNKLSQKPKQES